MGDASNPMSDVVLRLVGPKDESRFIELARLSSDFHRSWVVLPRSPDDFARYLAGFDQVAAVGMVVCLRDGGDMVGMVNINGIVRGSYQRGVLGYAAFLPYAGAGYMAAGVALAVRYGFETLGLHRVEADIQPANLASLRLVERVGLRKEGLSRGFVKINGIWCDHERWAITRDMPVIG